MPGSPAKTHKLAFEQTFALLLLWCTHNTAANNALCTSSKKLKEFGKFGDERLWQAASMKGHGLLKLSSQEKGVVESHYLVFYLSWEITVFLLESYRIQ